MKKQSNLKIFWIKNMILKHSGSKQNATYEVHDLCSVTHAVLPSKVLWVWKGDTTCKGNHPWTFLGTYVFTS